MAQVVEFTLEYGRMLPVQPTAAGDPSDGCGLASTPGETLEAGVVVIEGPR
jgi:hypothetical protein